MGTYTSSWYITDGDSPLSEHKAIRKEPRKTHHIVLKKHHVNHMHITYVPWATAVAIRMYVDQWE